MMAVEMCEQELGQPRAPTPVPAVTPAQRMGDIGDIAAIYERYRADIYGFICHRVHHQQDAEDLTAEVFVKAFHRLDLSRHDWSIRSWLFRVAHTVVADHWRVSHRRNLRSLDDLLARGWDVPAATPQNAVHESALARLPLILARLPSRDRDVLTMRFLMGRSVKETAAYLGLTDAHVKVLTFRALRKAHQVDQASQERST
jgi:RNA polymerase sigma-70 factor, ECF subfamily